MTFWLNRQFDAVDRRSTTSSTRLPLEQSTQTMPLPLLTIPHARNGIYARTSYQSLAIRMCADGKALVDDGEMGVGDLTFSRQLQ